MLRYAHFRAPFLCYALTGKNNAPCIRQIGDLPPCKDSVLGVARTESIEVSLSETNVDARMPCSQWFPGVSVEGEVSQSISEGWNDHHCSGSFLHFSNDRKPSLSLVDKRAVPNKWSSLPSMGISSTFRWAAGQGVFLYGTLICPPFRHPAPKFKIELLTTSQVFGDISGVCPVSGTFLISDAVMGWRRGDVPCSIFEFD